MNKYELLEKVNDMRAQNKIRIGLTEYRPVREAFQVNNDILGEITYFLNQESSEDYEKGLNDAWELAQKIGGGSHPGFYDVDELNDIFGWDDTADIFDHFSYAEAVVKVQEYEKKKAEEAAKPVRGDIVRYYIGCSVYDALFLCESPVDQCYWVLKENEEFPQRLSKENFRLIKTGKHVDLDGLFKESNDD